MLKKLKTTQKNKKETEKGSSIHRHKRIPKAKSNQLNLSL